MAATGFRRKRGGKVAFSTHPDEAVALRGLLEQLVALVAPEAPADADPLAAMVGIGTATEIPADPVLARLFPDAYADDDEAAGEFRRYTENTIRERKHAAALLALATLDDPGQERVLSPEQVQAWLGALNDIRLALGTRLDIEEDWGAQYRSLAEDDPERLTFEVYDWLSWLQESLVRCLG